MTRGSKHMGFGKKHVPGRGGRQRPGSGCQRSLHDAFEEPQEAAVAGGE